MKTETSPKRSSGVLMHISSLPGPHGIGDLGPNAYTFIDFLAETGQTHWQFLPTGPTSPSFDNSPYMTLSAFAGNPLFISPDKLIKDGWICAHDLNGAPSFSEYLVEFSMVAPFKEKLLHISFQNFQRQRRAKTIQDDFDVFCRDEKWLNEYALYMSLREENQLKPWHQWPKELARRDPESLTEASKRLADRILYYQFEQFCFFKQWNELHDYASRKNISFIGDIPIYVGMDSADVWANQDIFKLDATTLLPTHVAGVPPDYFSKTGQRWGNPIYRWLLPSKKPNMALYTWWQERFHQVLSMTDITRVDHFRGFESYWEIPAREKTAIKGRWIKGPGLPFFAAMQKKLGSMPIIAEDLGIITKDVEKLRDELGFPGMKILQFAFDSDSSHTYLPHNFETTNCIVYTGTHDNNTTLGWFLDNEGTIEAKTLAVQYSRPNAGEGTHWALLRYALSSIAAIAIIPMQDILGFGSDCRMNTPSTSKGNWRWRCAPRFITADIKKALFNETSFYNRCNKRGATQEDKPT